MKTKYLLLIPILSLLCSCSTSRPLVFEKYDTYVLEKEVKKDISSDVYYQKKTYSSISYENYSKNIETINSYRDLYKNTNDGRTYLNAPSTGDRKLLVIPVCFTDSDTSTLSKKKILIENAFFGKESTTSNESIASYYNKSSYGQLKIDGIVSDWYTFPYKSYELESKISSIINATSRYITSKAIDWYKENYTDILDYDTDKDDYIDGVYIVYDAPKKDKSSLYWAYTDHLKANEPIQVTDLKAKVTVNVTSPYCSTYSWTSVDFLNESNNYADAHTFIHETGHIFGLLDFYSDGNYQPTGYMDMMDYNLGDHSSFSKMLLNWVTPKVIKNEGEIIIKPFEDNGDVILIPSNSYNDTPFDEYLLIEYYTPTYLNKKDSELYFLFKDLNGQTQKGHLFSSFGLKVYHVDARIAYLAKKSIKTSAIALLGDSDLEGKLEDARGKIPSWCMDFAYSNNDRNTSYPINHLLEKSGENTFLQNQPANESTLFKIGDSFGINTFKDFTFHNGDKLNYTFKVDSLTPNEAKISFQKIK